MESFSERNPACSEANQDQMTRANQEKGLAQNQTLQYKKEVNEQETKQARHKRHKRTSMHIQANLVQEVTTIGQADEDTSKLLSQIDQVQQENEPAKDSQRQFNESQIQEVQQITRLFLPKQHHRAESGSTGYSFPIDSDMQVQEADNAYPRNPRQTQPQTEQISEAINEQILPSVQLDACEQSHNRRQLETEVATTPNKNLNRGNLEESQSQREGEMQNQPKKVHFRNMTSEIDQSESNTPTLHEESEGTFVEHSVVIIDGNEENQDDETDYLHALQSMVQVEMPISRQQAEDGVIASGSGSVPIQVDGGSGGESFLPSKVPNNYIQEVGNKSQPRLGKEAEKMMEKQILELRDRIRRGELLDCQKSQQVNQNEDCKVEDISSQVSQSNSCHSIADSDNRDKDTTAQNQKSQLGNQGTSTGFMLLQKAISGNSKQNNKKVQAKFENQANCLLKAEQREFMGSQVEQASENVLSSGQNLRINQVRMNQNSHIVKLSRANKCDQKQVSTPSSAEGILILSSKQSNTNFGGQQSIVAGKRGQILLQKPAQKAKDTESTIRSGSLERQSDKSGQPQGILKPSTRFANVSSSTDRRDIYLSNGLKGLAGVEKKKLQIFGHKNSLSRHVDDLNELPLKESHKPSGVQGQKTSDTIYSPTISNCITTDAASIFNKKKQRMEKIKQMRGISSNSATDQIQINSQEAKTEQEFVPQSVENLPNFDLTQASDKTANRFVGVRRCSDGLAKIHILPNFDHNNQVDPTADAFGDIKLQKSFTDRQTLPDRSKENISIKKPTEKSKRIKMHPTRSLPSTPRRIQSESLKFNADKLVQKKVQAANAAQKSQGKVIQNAGCKPKVIQKKSHRGQYLVSQPPPVTGINSNASNSTCKNKVVSKLNLPSQFTATIPQQNAQNKNAILSNQVPKSNQQFTYSDTQAQHAKKSQKQMKFSSIDASKNSNQYNLLKREGESDPQNSTQPRKDGRKSSSKVDSMQVKQTNLFGQAKKIVYSSEISQGIYGQKKMSIGKACKLKDESQPKDRQIQETRLAKNQRIAKAFNQKEPTIGADPPTHQVVSELQLERMQFMLAKPPPVTGINSNATNSTAKKKKVPRTLKTGKEDISQTGQTSNNLQNTLGQKFLHFEQKVKVEGKNIRVKNTNRQVQFEKSDPSAQKSKKRQGTYDSNLPLSTSQAVKQMMSLFGQHRQNVPQTKAAIGQVPNGHKRVSTTYAPQKGSNSLCVKNTRTKDQSLNQISLSTHATGRIINNSMNNPLHLRNSTNLRGSAVMQPNSNQKEQNQMASAEFILMQTTPTSMADHFEQNQNRLESQSSQTTLMHAERNIALSKYSSLQNPKVKTSKVQKVPSSATEGNTKDVQNYYEPLTLQKQLYSQKDAKRRKVDETQSIDYKSSPFIMQNHVFADKFTHGQKPTHKDIESNQKSIPSQSSQKAKKKKLMPNKKAADIQNAKQVLSSAIKGQDWTKNLHKIAYNKTQDQQSRFSQQIVPADPSLRKNIKKWLLQQNQANLRQKRGSIRESGNMNQSEISYPSENAKMITKNQANRQSPTSRLISLEKASAQSAAPRGVNNSQQWVAAVVGQGPTRNSSQQVSQNSTSCVGMLGGQSMSLGGGSQIAKQSQKLASHKDQKAIIGTKKRNLTGTLPERHTNQQLAATSFGSSLKKNVANKQIHRQNQYAQAAIINNAKQNKKDPRFAFLFNSTLSSKS